MASGEHISSGITDPTAGHGTVHLGTGLPPVPHPRLQRQLARAGFHGIDTIIREVLDQSLLQALVERWRQETHTFHFQTGEMSITLQDIEMITGMVVDGDTVTCPRLPPAWTGGSWDPYLAMLTGYTARELWEDTRPRLLATQFSTYYVEATRDVIWEELAEADLETFARSYILILLAKIFSDSDSNYLNLAFLVHLENLDQSGRLSWGSAALAFLYRQMCRFATRNTETLTGPLVILQIWAYSRLKCVRPSIMTRGLPDRFVGPHVVPPPPFGRRWTRGAFSRIRNPTHNISYFRDRLAILNDTEIDWLPYQQRDDQGNLIVAVYPNDDREATWLTSVPLIMYHIVEWHRPERVLRQFGFAQTSLTIPTSEDALHRTNLKGRDGAAGPTDWSRVHAAFIHLWTARQRYMPTRPFTMSSWNRYLLWYTPRTRLHIRLPHVQEPDQYRPHAKTNTFLSKQFKVLKGWFKDAVKSNPARAHELEEMKAEARLSGVDLGSDSSDLQEPSSADEEEDAPAAAPTPIASAGGVGIHDYDIGGLGYPVGQQLGQDIPESQPLGQGFPPMETQPVGQGFQPVHQSGSISGFHMAHDPNYSRVWVPHAQYFTPLMPGGYYHVQSPPAAPYAPHIGASSSAGAGAFYPVQPPPGSLYAPHIGAASSAGAGAFYPVQPPPGSSAGAGAFYPVQPPPGSSAGAGGQYITHYDHPGEHPHYPPPTQGHSLAGSTSAAGSDQQPHIAPGTQPLAPSHSHHSSHSRHSGDRRTGVSDLFRSVHTGDLDFGHDEDIGFGIDQTVEQVPQQDNPRRGLRKKKDRAVCRFCQTPLKSSGCPSCRQRH